MKEDDEVKLTVKQIREAAQSCMTAKRILMQMFPQVFDKGEYFHFGESFALTTNPMDGSPLFIGNGLAQDGEQGKVLIVSHGWRLKVVKDYNDDQTGLLFKKK